MFSVSLFKSALPSAVNARLQLPKGGNPQNYDYKTNLSLGKLVLEIGSETAAAIINHQYKHFDALVRNFGCQITALEVQQILQTADIVDEAIRVKKAAEVALQNIEQQFSHPTIGGRGEGVTDYLVNKAGVDFEVSPEFAKLVRFKILNIINTDVLVNNREIPFTKIENLQAKVNVNIPAKAWVENLQAEEARSAAAFIKQVGKSRFLDEVFVRSSKKSPQILSTPQLFNGEASLCGVRGIVLVKNKLSVLDTEPQKVYIKMPENCILTTDEVDQLQDSQALYVMEGFVKKGLNLEECIQRFGIYTLFNATLAQENQYASDTDQSPINDPEALAYIAHFKNETEAYEAIKFEHVYCASVKEER